MKMIGKYGSLLALAMLTVGAGGCRDRRFIERCAEERIQKDFREAYDRHGFEGLEFSDIKLELIGNGMENVSGRVTVKVPSKKFYPMHYLDKNIGHTWHLGQGSVDTYYETEEKSLLKRYNAIADTMPELMWYYGDEIEKIHEKGYFTGTFTVTRGKTSTGELAPLGYGKFKWDGKDPFLSTDFGTMETVKALHALKEGSPEARERDEAFDGIVKRMNETAENFYSVLGDYNVELRRTEKNWYVDKDKIHRIDTEVESLEYKYNDELSKLKYQLNQKESAHEAAQKQLNKIREELAAREKQIAGRPERMAELKAKVEEMEPKYEAIKSKHNTLGAESRAEVARLKAECDAAKRALEKTIPRYVTVKVRVGTRSKPNPMYVEGCAKIEERFQAARAEIQKKVDESYNAGMQFKEELNKCKSEYARLSRELPPAEKALAKCREKAQRLEADAAAKEKLFQEAKTRYEARFKELQEAYTKAVAEVPMKKKLLRQRMEDHQRAQMQKCSAAMKKAHAELCAVLDEAEAFIRRYGK